MFEPGGMVSNGSLEVLVRLTLSLAEREGSWCWIRKARGSVVGRGGGVSSSVELVLLSSELSSCSTEGWACESGLAGFGRVKAAFAA